jgi:hypothetical protein
MNTATETALKPYFPAPAVNDGETYVGAVIENGRPHHVILLPGDNNDATHAKALAWAKKQGGDLPSRMEALLLFQTQREAFKRDWYWTNAPVESDAGCAWSQSFNYGNQNWSHVLTKCRARAVRRFPIE